MRAVGDCERVANFRAALCGAALFFAAGPQTRGQDYAFADIAFAEDIRVLLSISAGLTREIRTMEGGVLKSEPRPLHLHTLDSLVADLVSGRPIKKTECPSLR